MQQIEGELASLTSSVISIPYVSISLSATPAVPGARSSPIILGAVIAVLIIGTLAQSASMSDVHDGSDASFFSRS